MAVLPEAITEGASYITEENSLGYAQVKEVLHIVPDRQDFLRDVIEYRSKTVGAHIAPWVVHKCQRKTFAGNVSGSVTKKAA